MLNSAYSAALLARHAPDAVAKSRVIPHGIDATRFHDSAVTSEDAAALAGLGIVPPYFLHVGQMYPYKGAETAAAAFAGYPASHHRLVMIGRFDPRFSTGEHYRRQILSLTGTAADRVVMLDALPLRLLRAAYRGAQAYLQPLARRDLR